MTSYNVKEPNAILHLCVLALKLGKLFKPITWEDAKDW